ncbi:MAG: HPP family protein [Pseudarthrobacter sp.]|nr:HPP family protein [Pseudarthrobacter sp.]NUS35615.1 HPP family protein [Pseudarthrobacter sp.]
MKPPLLDRAKERWGKLGAGLYAAVLGIVVLAATGLAGLLSHLPWLFPSLGPTVMLFFESPEQKASRPLNTLVGHGVGLAAGALCLYAFGLQDQPSAPVGGLTPLHLLSGALSVGLTTLVLTLLGLPHPPAGATTLIVSLGILSAPVQLASMAGAIILTTVLGWGLNALLGTRPAGKTGSRQARPAGAPGPTRPE